MPIIRRPPRAGGVSGVASSAPILTGVVESGTAATSTQAGNDLTLGTVNVWQYLTESEVDAFDPAESYDVDKPVRLTAEPHDPSGVTYNAGDLVEQGGRVYRADGATAGTFNPSGWTDLGDPGVKFANTSVAAGDYDPAEWDDATGDRFIDRTKTTVALDNHFEGDDPENGAVAKWIGTRLIGFTCKAQAGWS